MKAQMQFKPLPQSPPDPHANRWDLNGALALANRAQQTQSSHTENHKPLVPASNPHSAAVGADQISTSASGLQTFVDRVRRMMDAGGAALAEAREGEIVCIARSGPIAPGLGVSQNRGFTADCIRTGEALFCEDADIDAWADRQACRQIGARSLVLVPVLDESHVIGVLGVFSVQRGHFARCDVDALRWVASVLASMLRPPAIEDMIPAGPAPIIASPEGLVPEQPQEVPGPAPSVETPVVGPQLVVPADRLPTARRRRVLPIIVAATLIVVIGVYLYVRTPRRGAETRPTTEATSNLPQSNPAADTAPLGAAEKVATSASAPVREPPPNSQATNLLRKILYSSDSDRTVVTIETDAPTAYKVNTAMNPDRIYLDLKGAHLAPGSLSISGIQDGRLQRIRIGQFDVDVARVVLDLLEPATYSITRDTNPGRLLVELRAADRGGSDSSPTKRKR